MAFSFIFASSPATSVLSPSYMTQNLSRTMIFPKIKHQLCAKFHVIITQSAASYFSLPTEAEMDKYNLSIFLCLHAFLKCWTIPRPVLPTPQPAFAIPAMY
jgi:hypothetical protein